MMLRMQLLLLLFIPVETHFNREILQSISTELILNVRLIQINQIIHQLKLLNVFHAFDKDESLVDRKW